jgi:prevent-host-death family protein
LQRQVTATYAKNEFGRVLETAIERGAVAITRHGQTKAVLLSVDEFNALAGSRHDDLDALDAEFDALLDEMQRPTARAALQQAFEAGPARLGKAALKAARKRG